MTYSLSFVSEFFKTPDDRSFEEISNADLEENPPTSVCEALLAMPDEEWDEMATNLGFPLDVCEIDDILRVVEETNTCSNLDSPVEVWIDQKGSYRVLVYEKKG